ncbi:hypothetical protein AvCA_27890 [Azotobacter vinelandii CA]|uniref:Uncharacterized protein n=2 Tax=Azotobacter vinelandii TaxID=354 RepID=C1DKV9_AZOVD|nr:hypothetical protein [Azotobacter vinelandii]ACO78961.1 hypothetical protein Avin_27890 [Azotobacter vinelandii DJ]AGK16544.1 hypothetical protein AvCA_27890 [Azotobacter vinelandii CA]AGK20875.1 hypothetical protein AvCA6_27890 [Azotobacter vinelandii CA6]SFY12448.1 hypothetical protein SAMN04244547_04092 [Azotobacter vinelandii]GLK59722.1 hypothetical protein GCM10017624_18790 [Azotobacter vinelandii]
MAGPEDQDGFGPLDQAAGLRRWAARHGADAESVVAAPSVAAPSSDIAGTPRPTLMVVGLPSGSRRLERVRQALRRWRANGHAWVGDPARWQLVALAEDSPHLHTLACQQPRWGLWVEGDPDGFRRAYRCLRRLREGGGPIRLLVVHPGFVSHAGLLDNLRQAASAFLGIELLLLTERPAGPRG